MTFSNKLLMLNLVILLLFNSITMSQDIQLAGFSFTKFPNAEVIDSPLNQEVEVNEYNFFLNFPKRLKNNKTILINGLQYRLVSPSAEHDHNLGINDQNLHMIGYRLTALHQFTNNWRVLVSINPTLSSSFDTKPECDDFLFNGILHFIKEKSDHLSYGAGIAYTSRFGKPIPIPTLQLTLSSEKDKFEIFLPRHLIYDHYFGKFTVGLQAVASGSRYNVNYSGTNMYNVSEPVNMLAYSRVVIGPSISYRIGKVIELEASGGITAARRFELQSDLFEDIDYFIANEAFLRFGIAIVLPKRDKML